MFVFKGEGREREVTVRGETSPLPSVQFKSRSDVDWNDNSLT